jgi:phospholipid transport system transporter-binding protein
VKSGDGAATFETLQDERSRVLGSLDFETVAKLLPQGTAAITAGHAAVIDLSGVTASDSSGLALLLEWMSVAKEAGRSLQYDNMPPQLYQLAHLSEVDALLIKERMGREAG